MTSEPPGEPCVPAVFLKMGCARVTERSAVSLSIVTARGVAITFESALWFRKDKVALRPSAFKKAVGSRIKAHRRIL